MFIIISKKKLNKLLCEAYDKGVNNRYFLTRWMERNKALRQAEEILRKAGEDNNYA